jgi:pyruvate/2-oxoglutarate dehydrogenase complex dihydrolipoamide dehydrogenase (E3) component
VSESRDLIVLGGGVAGLVVTSVAAQLGLKVTLIERSQRLGGDCLHYGCVPSKTLLRAAKVADLMRRGIEYGLPSVAPEVDLARVNEHVRRVIDTIQAHDDPERFRGYGAEVLFGHARFLDPHTLDFRDRRIRARRFVIATGSRPLVPPIDGIETIPYLTNESVFALEQLPPRLVVLGAGAIGVELGQAFARLGSRVTLIEAQSRILPSEDPEMSELLAGVLQQQGIAIRTGVRIERVECLDKDTLIHSSAGRTVTCDRVLVATGRRPNIEDLGLDAAGVRCKPLGVVVDERMRTSRRHIYACGDVCGRGQLTHMAEYQAGIVIANAIFRFPRRMDPDAVPRVFYSDPEFAQAGLSEPAARERYGGIEVQRLDFSGVDRAITDVQTQGRIKLVIRRGRLIGATVVGPQAGELIHELALAISARIKLTRIADMVHAYPTLALSIRRAINAYLAPQLFNERTRRLVIWLNRLLP